MGMFFNELVEVCQRRLGFYSIWVVPKKCSFECLLVRRYCSEFQQGFPIHPDISFQVVSAFRKFLDRSKLGIFSKELIIIKIVL